MTYFLRLLTLSLPTCLTLAAADWPTFRGSHARDATSPETGLMREWPEAGPPLLWTVTGMGAGHGSVVIQGDTAYLLTQERKAKKGKPIPNPQKVKGSCLVALNMADGSIRWQQSCKVGNATPTIAGKHLYGQSRGVVFCLALANGAPVWQTDVTKLLEEVDPGWKDKGRYDPWAGSPLVDDTHIYLNVGSPKLSVVALRREDGSVAWSGKGPPELEGRGYGSPALFRHAGKNLLITTTIIHVLGFDPTTGTLLWSNRLQDRPKPHCGIGNVPVYADGLLHVSSCYGGPIGKAFRIAEDGQSITEAWDIPTIHPLQESVTCVEGRLFGYGSLLWEHCDQEVLVDGEPLGERIKLLSKAKFGRKGLSKMVVKESNKEKLNGLNLKGGLVCQDLKTGKVLGYRTGLKARSGHNGHICLAADGLLFVFFTADCSQLFLLDADPAMTIRGRVATPVPEVDPKTITWTGFTPPSLSDGRLVMRFGDMLFCYQVGK